MAPWPVLLLVPALALAAGFKGVDHEHWTTRYDHYFRKYAKHYFGPVFDWRWFKAQGIAESGLDPKARSKAGAVGIMQIMPGTFEYIRKKNPSILSIEDPKWNIAAGIFYDRHLYDKWEGEPLDGMDRLFFTFGAYNAGHYRVRRAYNKLRKQGKPATWQQVDDLLPAETRRYVARIRKLMSQPL